MAEENNPARGFEQGLDELEEVVKELESGDVPLEQALELFERGVKVSERCRKMLEEAEQKVEILLKKNDGAEAEPFEPEKS